MKTLGIVNIVCGIVLTVVMVFEAATDSVTVPIMFLLGPGFLLVGILEVARARKRERRDPESPVIVSDDRHR